MITEWPVFANDRIRIVARPGPTMKEGKRSYFVDGYCGTSWRAARRWALRAAHASCAPGFRVIESRRDPGLQPDGAYRVHVVEST